MIKKNNSLDKINVVGDRVLVKPRKESEKTDSGLYLPPGVREKEKVQYGYIVKSGPGYPIPIAIENDQPWKTDDEKIKYIPLQVKQGDLAVFLQGGAYEVIYQGEKYNLYVRDQKIFKEGEKARNSLEHDRPPRFIDKQTFFIQYMSYLPKAVRLKYKKVSKLIAKEDQTKLSKMKNSYRKISSLNKMISLISNIDK